MWPEYTVGRSSMINCEGCKFHLSHADWCQFHLSRGEVNPGLLGVGRTFEESDEEGRLGVGRKTGEVPADREQKKVNVELHPDSCFIWNSAVNK